MTNLSKAKALALALLSILFAAPAPAHETNRSPSPQRRETRRRYNIRMDKSRKVISSKVGQTKGSQPLAFNLVNVDVPGLVIKDEKFAIDWGKGKISVTAVVENPSVFTSKSAFLVAEVLHISSKETSKMAGPLDFYDSVVVSSDGVAVPPVEAGKSVTLEIDLTEEYDFFATLPPGTVKGVRCILITSLPN